MSATSLTLYDLSRELVELMDRYDEAMSEPNIEAAHLIETELRAYAAAHVRKVDSIRAMLRHCELMIDGARREIATQKANEETWERRRDVLKDICVEVMTAFRIEELKGQKGVIKLRLDGETGSFLLKGNGGKQPVTIANPELVPDEFCVYEGKIPASMWPFIVSGLAKLATPEMWDTFQALEMVRTPRKSLIEAELQKPCDNCLGIGSIPRDFPETIATCEACGGSGKRGVPGCSLEPRGVHLEVK